MKPTRNPSLWTRCLRTAAALALGICVGVIFHYMIYRFSLPAKPFIYVAF